MNKKVLLGLGIMLIVSLFVAIRTAMLPLKDNTTSNLDKNDDIYYGKMDLDIFYNDEVTKGYKDIRQLGSDYNYENAILDNCYVVGTIDTYNSDLLDNFLEKYNNEEKTFIRIGLTTEEGDLVIFDIMYDGNKLYFVSDYTRDKFSASSSRVINLNVYESITKFNMNNDTFLVLYNGVNVDETFNQDNSFVVTKIVK